MKMFCDSCKHFIGAGDFALCCSKDYGLYYETSKSCDKFELGDYDNTFFYNIRPAADGFTLLCRDAEGNLYWGQKSKKEDRENSLTFRNAKTAELFIRQECAEMGNLVPEEFYLNTKVVFPQ